jgi:hypothetical protein
MFTQLHIQVEAKYVILIQRNWNIHNISWNFELLLIFIANPVQCCQSYALMCDMKIG